MRSGSWLYMERNKDDSPFLQYPGPEACPVKADPRLIAEGWQQRHFADPERAKESIALYSSMGFEVKTEKLKASDFSPSCQACALSACNSFVMIYTRMPKPNDESSSRGEENT